MSRTLVETQNELFTDASEANPALEEIRQENNAVAAADAVIMSSFNVTKAIGRIETANFMRNVADKLIAETAINIRDGKKYKDLPFKTSSGEVRNVADFKEFCEVFLGRSYRRTMELISNYNQLGPELYEQAELLGFRQRDYNALKALPADDRKLIAQAIEEENFDKALDLMQEMAAKHQREKEAADKKLTDLTERLEAKDGVIKEKTEELNKKSERINLLEAARRKDVQEEAMPGEYQLSILQDYTRTITAKISATMSSEIQKLVNEFDGLPPKHIELAIAQSLGLVITAAYGVADYWRIDPITDPETAAEDPAKADAEAFLQWDAQQSGE